MKLETKLPTNKKVSDENVTVFFQSANQNSELRTIGKVFTIDCFPKQKLQTETMNRLWDQALRYRLDGKKLVAIRNPNTFNCAKELANAFYREPTKYSDSVFQMIFPHRDDTRGFKTRNPSLNLPISVFQTSNEPCITLFSTLSWLESTLPKLKTLQRPLTVILVEAAKHSAHLEVILKLLVHCKKDLKIRLRVIWIPAYDISTLSLPVEIFELSSRYDNEVPQIEYKFSDSDLDYTTSGSCALAALKIIRRIHESKKQGDIFVVLPSFNEALILHSELNRTEIRDDYSMCVLQTTREKIPEREESVKSIFLASAGLHIFKRFYRVTTLIDCAVRKVSHRLNPRIVHVVPELVSISEIRRFVDSISTKSHPLTVELPITESTYKSLWLFPHKMNETTTLGWLILTLEYHRFSSFTLFCTSKSNHSAYDIAVNYLNEGGMVTSAPSSNLISLTPLGNFTILSKLSSEISAFLFDVLSSENTASSPPYYKYVACLTAVWLDSGYDMFLQVTDNEQLIKMTEYTREDTLLNSIDVYLQSRLREGFRYSTGKSWCRNRGVHWPALKDFSSNVFSMILRLSRDPFLSIDTREFIIPVDYIPQFLDSDLENAKYHLEPYLRKHFSDDIYTHLDPSDQNIFPEIDLHDEHFFSSNVTGEVFTIDRNVEQSVVEELARSGVDFIAKERSLDTQGRQYLKRIIALTHK